jgi:hypothetical protein
MHEVEPRLGGGGAREPEARREGGGGVARCGAVDGDVSEEALRATRGGSASEEEA